MYNLSIRASKDSSRGHRDPDWCHDSVTRALCASLHETWHSLDYMKWWNHLTPSIPCFLWIWNNGCESKADWNVVWCNVTGTSRCHWHICGIKKEIFRLMAIAKSVSVTMLCSIQCWILYKNIIIRCNLICQALFSNFFTSTCIALTFIKYYVDIKILQILDHQLKCNASDFSDPWFLVGPVSMTRWWEVWKPSDTTLGPGSCQLSNIMS